MCMARAAPARIGKRRPFIGFPPHHRVGPDVCLLQRNIFAKLSRDQLIVFVYHRGVVGLHNTPDSVSIQESVGRFTLLLPILRRSFLLLRSSLVLRSSSEPASDDGRIGVTSSCSIVCLSFLVFRLNNLDT